MKVKLLRPLDGQDIGSVVDYPDADAKRLESSGVVSFVKEKAEPVEVKDDDAPVIKAAPAPENKMAPEPQNKAAPRGRPRKGQ